MKKLAAAVLTGLMALAPLAGPAGAVETERTVVLNDKDAKTAEWTGDAMGIAPDFFLGGTAGSDYECGATFEGNCEYTLIEITGLTEAEIAAATAAGTLGTLKDSVPTVVGITNFSVPVSDMDIIVYASDADGTKGAELGRVGDLDTDPSEEFTTSVITTGANPTQYLLLEVVFFAAAGTYDGYVRVS